METHQSSERTVLMAVAAAEARRRRRHAGDRLWRLAPFVAGVCLATAGLSRWVATSRTLPLVLIALSAAGLALYTLLLQRTRGVSDAVAAEIDRDGGFDGELRSASWFAARAGRDEWAAFHLDRAAARLASTDWSALYPPVRNTRARLLTAGILLGAIGLALSLPGRALVRASIASGVGAGKGAGALPISGRMELIPEDLRKQIEELLAAAQLGSLPAEKQMAKAAEIWNLFNAINTDLDPEKLKELAKAMDPTKKGSLENAKNKLMDLAGKALQAADTPDLPQALKQAFEDLSSQMAQAADAEGRMAADQAESASAQGGGKDGQPGGASANAPPQLDQASIQFSKDSPAAGAGMMMMSTQPGPKGDPGGGFGGAGNSGKPPNGGLMPGLESALRKETIEASDDALGDNVLSETRRKTERGQATVGFTRGAAGAADRSRASAPPPVPEGRRAAVQTYFTRKQ